MATENQIRASRRNAQKSTGPRSGGGKAASRWNACKTGIHAKSMIIPGESPAELDALATEYHEQFRPSTALERFLVDSLVYADWQLRRLRRIEAQLWAKEIDAARESNFRPLNEDAPLGDVFDRAPSSWMLLQRRLDSTERSYYRALTQLQRLRAGARPAPDSRSTAPDPRAPEPGGLPATSPLQPHPQSAEQTRPCSNLASFCNSPFAGVVPLPSLSPS